MIPAVCSRPEPRISIWHISSGLPVVLDDGNQYLYGAGLSAMKQSGNWFYYLADGLGSTMAIVDADGDVQNGYTYDVYGEPTVTGSLANEFDFAGQQTDPTGLQYLRARYYDPVSGTFLSREPLERAPGWMGNPFGYARGNPARFVDPTGNRPCDVDDCGPGVGRKYPAPVPNGGPDMPNGDVPVEPTSVYGVCAGIDFYRHPHCRDLVPDANIFLDIRDSILIQSTRMLIGEYNHDALVACVRNDACRDLGDAVLGARTVHSVELGAVLKNFKYAAIVLLISGQSWEAYKRRYGED